MEQLYQETAGQLADRWTVLMNELNRYGSGHYPDLLCIEILRLVHETGRLATTDPFETDLIFAARALIDDHQPKMAMFKLHEVISGRLYHR
ncbi:hypothetical protein [Paraburkholderia strydomiana]|uniref:hypothetical protein n=1 Tax=Paraburkholderia strydomiana TaxID=1245417 RepID=UPI001BE529A0|nr:hypothetical protein [Paraburkholderia strydomiana]MBT2793507.1 hypothetical protein [Paraburkholderia strydomiana]